MKLCGGGCAPCWEGGYERTSAGRRVCSLPRRPGKSGRPGPPGGAPGCLRRLPDALRGAADRARRVGGMESGRAFAGFRRGCARPAGGRGRAEPPVVFCAARLRWRPGRGGGAGRGLGVVGARAARTRTGALHGSAGAGGGHAACHGPDPAGGRRPGRAGQSRAA